MLIGSVILINALAVKTFAKYTIDKTWNPEFPKGTGTFSAVAVTGDEVVVSQRDAHNPNPIIVLSKKGELLRTFGGAHVAVVNNTFGSHGLAVQAADPANGRKEETVWIMDFFNHTVLSFTLHGDLLGKAGRPGVASLDADKFGMVADAVFRKGKAYFADGDGGSDNRVECWEASSGKPERVAWVSPVPSSPRATTEFENPHGIAWHQTTDRLLIADREHARIAMMDPETGSLSGNLTCDSMRLGPAGKPFGVRTLKTDSQDLLFVAVANNPQDGKNQFVHVADLSGLQHGHGCQVVQSISIDPTFCHTPHLMGVDHSTGHLYLACVAEPDSNVIRLVQDDQVVIV